MVSWTSLSSLLPKKSGVTAQCRSWVCASPMHFCVCGYNWLTIEKGWKICCRKLCINLNRLLANSIAYQQGYNQHPISWRTWKKLRLGGDVFQWLLASRLQWWLDTEHCRRHLSSAGLQRRSEHGFPGCQLRSTPACRRSLVGWIGMCRNWKESLGVFSFNKLVKCLQE